MKELTGVISGDHFWLNSVNQCRFLAHVPLDDESTCISVRPIRGSLVEHLQQPNQRIFAVFDTIASTDQRWCALLFSHDHQ